MRYPFHPLRVIQAEQEADQRAPVVRHHSHAVEFERIEQRDHVCDQLLGGVTGSGRIGPARASQVRGYHPIALSQGRQDLVPPPPVLRKPVQQRRGSPRQRRRHASEPRHSTIDARHHPDRENRTAWS